MAQRISSHQLILLAVALALVAGLFLLPKVMVKPKEGKGELAQDAARTANRDNGAAAPSTAASGLDEHGHPAGSHDEAGAGASGAQHMAMAPTQRREINALLAKHRATTDPLAKLRVAADLAVKYKAAEKFDSAGYYYEQLAQARPGEQAWQRAADAYFEAFSFAATQERQQLLATKCQELYGKVLKNNPENLDAKTNLGMAFMASANPVQGVVLLREVLAADPRNEKAMYNLGLLSMQSNQYDKAVERFRTLTQVNPQNVNGQFYLGVSLAQTGAKAEAKTAFQKARSLSTDPSLTAAVDEQLKKLN